MDGAADWGLVGPALAAAREARLRRAWPGGRVDAAGAAGKGGAAATWWSHRGRTAGRAGGSSSLSSSAVSEPDCEACHGWTGPQGGELTAASFGSEESALAPVCLGG